MGNRLSHDWNYEGNQVWKCWNCGKRDTSSSIPSRTSLDSQICSAKKQKENSKLPPMIRRLIESKN